MRRLRINFREATASVFAPAVEALRGGGIVAFPTETFYGLAVDPRSAPSVRKLFTLKGRGPDHPFPLIAADDRQVAEQVGPMTALAARLASKGWPGPLTLIIPAGSVLCPDVHLGTGRVAVRVPGHSVARALAEFAGHAITSTSANVSGHSPASTAEGVIAAFGNGIDVLIDAGPTSGGLPSTIVDATGTDPILIRAGAIPWGRVLEFLR